MFHVLPAVTLSIEPEIDCSFLFVRARLGDLGDPPQVFVRSVQPRLRHFQLHIVRLQVVQPLL